MTTRRCANCLLKLAARLHYSPAGQWGLCDFCATREPSQAGKQLHVVCASGSVVLPKPMPAGYAMEADIDQYAVARRRG